MPRNLKFRPSLADTKRANKSALDFYASASGRATPPEQEALHADVKPKQTRGPRKPSLLPSESEVQRSIIAFLCAHPKVALVIRFNSGAVSDGKYYVEFAHIYSRGFGGEKMRLPDVHAMLRNGRPVWVEVKRGDWRGVSGQREIEQENFLKHIRACGGIGIFAKSIDDVSAVLA